MSRAIVGSLSVFALLSAAFAGCTKDFDQFEPSAGTVSTGTAGQGGQGGEGGPGGAGGGGSCASDPDCDDKNPCTEDACAAGECSQTPVADGLVPGAPDDPKACTTTACAAGAVVTMNKPTDAACGGSLFCDGMGNCVGCTKANQCPNPGTDCKVRTCDNQVCGTMNVADGMPCQGGVCAAGVCVDMCKDGMMNGNETDVDCGGGSCPKCADGKLCDGDADCANNDCDGGVCVSCMDGQLNGDETDVDCGGDCQANCADGKICGGDGDCMSNDCSGSLCISCMDGQLNGSESDVDCGASCPTKCAGGKICNGNMDCISNKCSGGTCQP